MSYTASSSDSGVATASVSGNIVTVNAIAVGSAIIKVTAQNPGGLTATQSIAVTVEEPDFNSVPSHPKGLMFNFSPPIVRPGETINLISEWSAVSGATSYTVHVRKSLAGGPFSYYVSGSSCSINDSLSYETFEAFMTQETTYTYSFILAFDNLRDIDVQACNSVGCSCPEGYIIPF